MPQLEISRHHIVSLIDKISALQPHFTDQERQLLMSIFALAAEHAVQSGVPEEVILPAAASEGLTAEGSGPATVDELKQQLLHAYIPGSSFDRVTGSHAAATEVSHSFHKHSIHR